MVLSKVEESWPSIIGKVCTVRSVGAVFAVPTEPPSLSGCTYRAVKSGDADKF